MKFDLCFAKDGIQVTLTENLTLLEGQEPRLGLAASPAAFDLLPQIESLARQFLNGFVAGRCESR